MKLETRFQHPLTTPWFQGRIGAGQVEQRVGELELTLPPDSSPTYHDAQITDYQHPQDFRWQPPLRLTVTARFAAPAPLVGTAGFGFWNHPFVPGQKGFRLPKALWFFFSAPPSRMQLDAAVPGPGWKAATLDATRLPFLCLAPTAPLGFPLMRFPPLYRRLWPLGQRALGVSEHLLDIALLRQSHTYTIDWQPGSIRFSLDGHTLHQTPTAPRGPLGFIAWIDNQYAIVTPQGSFGFGVTPVAARQSLLIEHILIESTN